MVGADRACATVQKIMSSSVYLQPLEGRSRVGCGTVTGQVRHGGTAVTAISVLLCQAAAY